MGPDMFLPHYIAPRPRIEIVVGKLVVVVHIFEIRKALMTQGMDLAFLNAVFDSHCSFRFAAEQRIDFSEANSNDTGIV